MIRTPHNWGGLLEIDGVKKVDQNKSNLIPCTFPWYSLTIFYDGKVYLCPQDFEGRILLGDINKNSIKEIFNGEAIKKIRRDFKTGMIRKTSPCRECDRIWRKTFLGIPREYLKVFLKDNFRK